MHTAGRAFLMASCVAAVALVAVSHARIDDTAYGDGLIYRYVASHLTTPVDQIDPVVSSRGSALRYGRVGFPALIWLAAAGHNNAMPWSQAALIVAGAGAAGAATALLFPSAGAIGALLSFLAPGFALSVVGGYGEVIAVALALWATIELSRRRPWVAAGLVAGTLLVRENAGAVLIGLVIWEALQRRPKSACILATSLLPMLGWYIFVDIRFGHFPLFDPYLRVTTDTITTPFLAVARSLTHGGAGSMATAGIHLVLAIVAFILWRRSAFATIGAVGGLQVLASGVFAWHFVGDAMRAMTFLELFLLLALLRYRWPEPELTTASPSIARADAQRRTPRPDLRLNDD